MDLFIRGSRMISRPRWQTRYLSSALNRPQTKRSVVGPSHHHSPVVVHGNEMDLLFNILGWLQLYARHAKRRPHIPASRLKQHEAFGNSPVIQLSYNVNWINLSTVQSIPWIFIAVPSSPKLCRACTMGTR